MERLGTCIDALRLLAGSNDPDRAVLVERHIDAYLTTETGSVWQALERLCKSIRDDRDYWRQIDEYIYTETGTDFSHGICPACMEKMSKSGLL